MKKGLLITFEGIDGSGKSTQAAMLYRKLTEEDIPVVLTREPGGVNVSISEKIRNIILNHKSSTMDFKTELFLFMASRSQHIEELIRVKNDQGIHVICDRFTDASIAYQGYGRGIDLKLITDLNNIACSDVKPDKTFLLDISSDEFVVRKEKDNKGFDRIENSGKEFIEKVRQGYLAIAENESDRIVCLDGCKAVDEIGKQIYEVVKEIILR